MRKTFWVFLIVIAGCRHMPSGEELEDFQIYLTGQEQTYLLRSIQLSKAGKEMEEKIAAWDSLYQQAVSDPNAEKQVRDSIRGKADAGRKLLISWAAIRQNWSKSLAEGTEFLEMCHSGANLRRIELQIPQKVKEEVAMYNQQSLSVFSQMQSFPYPGEYHRKPAFLFPVPFLPKLSDTIR